MPTPTVINELPVVSRQDPRVTLLPSRERCRALRAKNYGTMIRLASVEREPILPPVSDINQHLSQTDTAFERIITASTGISGLDETLKIPVYEWCLIPLLGNERECSNLAHLIPDGFTVGAEVALVDGKTVTEGKVKILPDTHPTTIAENVIATYWDMAANSSHPILRDLNPTQFMYSRAGELTMYLVDIDPILSAPLA